MVYTTGRKRRWYEKQKEYEDGMRNKKQMVLERKKKQMV